MEKKTIGFLKTHLFAKKDYYDTVTAVRALADCDPKNLLDSECAFLQEYAANYWR